MINNKKYFIDLVNSSEANQFIRQYHYSHRGFPAAKINQGIYNKKTNKLVGVLQWGRSAAYNIRLNRYVKENLSIEHYLELNRFAMADSEEKNSESQAISLGIKWIKKYRPEIELLVFYAGRIEGNYGYIYQATNWNYLGYFISKGFYILDNDEFHLTSIATKYKKERNNNETIKDFLCRKYNTVIQYDSKQFIYTMILNRRLNSQEKFPYPKENNEYPIQTKINIIQQLPYKKSKKITYKNFYYNPNKPLFTNRCLRRRQGELLPKRTIYNYNLYDSFGKLIKTYLNKKEIIQDYPIFTLSGIDNASKNKKMYKNYYIMRTPIGKPIEKRIKVKNPLCKIGDKFFFKQIDVANFLNVSRQRVSEAKKSNSAHIRGETIVWYND